MNLASLRALVNQGAWACFVASLLGSLGLMARQGAAAWQVGAWGAMAAVAMVATYNALVIMPSTEDRLGAALLALAAAGATATATSPPLEPLALSQAVGWGTVTLLWYLLGTLHLEMAAQAPGLTAQQGALLAAAGVARLRAIAWVVPMAGALAFIPLAFAAAPLTTRATFGALLLLFAAIMGIVAGFYMGLKWYLYRRGASGKSG